MISLFVSIFPPPPYFTPEVRRVPVLLDQVPRHTLKVWWCKKVHNLPGGFAGGTRESGWEASGKAQANPGAGQLAEPAS